MKLASVLTLLALGVLSACGRVERANPPATVADLVIHDAIATLGTAAAIGVDDEVGVIESGYRANLVLWEGDPLTDPRALFGDRTVIKDGVIWTSG